MDSLSDVPLEVPIHHASAFDFDDAFSDGDSNEMGDQLSPDALREDLERNVRSLKAWMEPEGPLSDPFEDENQSVSTLDMNGNGPAPRSESPSQSTPSPSSPSPRSLEMSDHFSQISLSLSDNNGGWHSSSTGNLTIDDSVDNSYPSVIIDASEPGTSHLHRGISVTSISKDHGGEAHTTLSPYSTMALPPDTAYSTQSLPTPTPMVHEARTRPLSATATPTSAASPQPPVPVPDPDPASIPSSSSAPQPPPQPPQKPFKHRPTRSTGPSAFEKVRSKTRPTFLPPKPRQEDEKHMADWQSMMKLSRAAAEKRRKALQDRRNTREKLIEESIHTWEKEIVPDWRVVNKNPALRKLWWKGIPTKLRASMWERAVGNALALSKDHYRTCLARAKRALASGVFPEASMSLIEEDISTTLPSLHIFHHENGPLYGELKEMLCAWVVSRSDEGLGYTLGAAKIAAMLLINMPVQQGFVVMRNLLERHCMRSFYGGESTKEDVEAYYRIFDTLLADGMPKIYFNFKQHQISPSAYLLDWLLPLFINHLPFEACARVWDVLLLEGDSFLYRAALGILGVLEPRLFFPERKELMELLNGENKAAIDVAKREGLSLDGGKYEIYGVDEETLWERIDHMDEWWKESTWTRLLQRELPDI